VAVADMNGDKKPDVLVSDIYRDTVTIMLGYCY
jgi:hypothetical protein